MKQKFKRLLSAILSIVLVIGGLQVSGWTSKATTASAAGYIYFDASETGWTEVYVSFKGWSQPDKMESIGNNIFKCANPGSDFVIFTKSAQWNWIDSNPYSRTSQFNAVNIGHVYRITGKTETINNNEQYVIEDGGVYNPDGGGGTPTPSGTTRTIYLDTTAYAGGGWGCAYIYMFNNDTGATHGPEQMNQVSTGTGVFSYNVDTTTYPSVVFKPNAGGNWSGKTPDQTIPADKDKFTCTKFGSVTSGIWGSYEESEEGAFPSNVTGKATFFDLYTDHELTGNNYGNIYTGEEARSLTSILRAFDLGVNGTIDQYWRKKTTNGVTENGTTVYPLYFNVFDPLYKVWIKNTDPTADKKWWASSDNVRYDENNEKGAYENYANWFAGRLFNFSWWVNRSLDTTEANGSTHSEQNGAVVQGLVDDELDTHGNITTGGVVLPQFNPEFYTNYTYEGKAVGTQYQTVDFPFAVRKIGDVNYYQFDSGVNNGTYKDVVRFNADKSALLYYDGTQNQGRQIVYGITAEGNKSPGFFPFNEPGDSSEADSYDSVNNRLNYGFGMKLEIQFTMDADGRVNNTDKTARVPATFEFSGDDDVWIYVDGKLALDLGGDHSVATGKIDFSTLKNSDKITSTVSYVKAKGDNTNLSEIYSAESSYDDPGSINQIGKNGVGSITDVEKEITFDPNIEIHTLTIFYEERGMFESNFKATFNLEQPTKLKVTNEVNVDNINPALQAATLLAAAGDEFEYALKDKNDAGVTKKYTDENGNPGDVTNGALTLKKDQSATFVRQFDRKAELSLVQTEYPKYTTSWAFSEMNENEESGKPPISASYVEGKNLYAVSDSRTGDPAHADDRFLLENKNINEESVPARVIAQYVQNPKTGNISIKKELESGFASDEFFKFGVTFTKVFGSTDPNVLAKVNGTALTYNVYENDTLVAKRVATDSIIKIKAGQRAEITDIPVDSTYEITEDTDPTYQLVDISSKENNNDKDISTSGKVTGTVVADPNNEDGTITYDLFTFKNGEVRTSDAFLVELDKKNTVAVVPDASVDGTLSGDLKDIATAYNKATAGGKRVTIVFVNENGGLETEHTDAGEQPKKSYKTDGVTYTVGTDENGKPIITFTPTSDATKGKNTVTVKYQLVEVDENGIIKTTTTTVTDEDGKPTTEITNNIITPVITATNYLYKANNDIYVLDYGLDVDLADTATKYGLFQNDALANPSLTGTISTYWNTAKNASTEEATASTTMVQYTDPASGEYGTITPAAAAGTGFAISNQSSTTEAVNPTVTYSLKKFLANKDYFHYNVLVKKDNATEDTQTSNRYRVNLTSNVTIMPASVVYYEDNFNATNTTANDGKLKIIYTNSDAAPKVDPTASQSNDQNENYGHDAAYNRALEESGGSSTVLTNGDGAYFTFTGTGFDIISRTNSNTAGLIAYVFKGVKSGLTSATVGKEANRVKAITVDTFYRNGDLYQVPVISTTLDYDTYTVYLRAAATYTGQNTIYIDGIRIYQPLGTDVKKLGDYLKTEQAPTVEELRGLFTKGTIDLVQEDNAQIETGGSTVIELYANEEEPETVPGEGDYKQVSVDQLEAVITSGPNNELYVPLGNGIAFSVPAPSSDDWTLQIGAKSVSPDNGNANVTPDKQFTVWVKPDTSDVSEFVGWKTYKINTSTDMYYDLDFRELIKTQNWTADRYAVAIVNSSTEYDTYDIISLTNVKHSGSLSKIQKVSQTTTSNKPPLEAAKPVIQSAKFDVTSVTRGKYTDMVVITDLDVTDVKVYDPNGYEVTSFNKKNFSVDANSKKVWKLTFKVIKTKGKASYTIKAVVDGEIQEPETSASITIR